MDSLTFETPLGALTLLARNDALVAACFADPCHLAAPDGTARALLERARDDLMAYFLGGPRRFDLPLAPAGTPFQHAVWAALQRIEPGRTTTYSALARQLGRPGAARAVGRAVASNPLIILVPCHRVVSLDGSLTGFSAGLDRKRRLLAHEGAR